MKRDRRRKAGVFRGKVCYAFNTRGVGAGGVFFLLKEILLILGRSVLRTECEN